MSVWIESLFLTKIKKWWNAGWAVRSKTEFRLSKWSSPFPKPPNTFGNNGGWSKTIGGGPGNRIISDRKKVWIMTKPFPEATQYIIKRSASILYSIWKQIYKYYVALYFSHVYWRVFLKRHVASDESFLLDLRFLCRKRSIIDHSESIFGWRHLQQSFVCFEMQISQHATSHDSVATWHCFLSSVG